MIIGFFKETRDVRHISLEKEEDDLKAKFYKLKADVNKIKSNAERRRFFLNSQPNFSCEYRSELREESCENMSHLNNMNNHPKINMQYAPTLSDKEICSKPRVPSMQCAALSSSNLAASNSQENKYNSFILLKINCCKKFVKSLL